MDTAQSGTAEAFWNDLQFEGAAISGWDERPRRSAARVALPAFQPEADAVPVEASDWTLSPARRVLDFFVSLFALILFSPLLCIIAVCVRLSSPGPVIFRQGRVGRNGEVFTIFKFRTMEDGPRRKGLTVTRHGDRRITAIGAVLRRYKLDELPQLVNVLRGDMSLVGPRPLLPSHHREIHMPFRPGLTGAATLVFRREEELLRHIPDSELENFCLYRLTPYKARLDMEYASRANLRSDLRLLYRTAEVCLRRNKCEMTHPLKLV
jgi:lipopolysaccharide/colanic/teichoic acid biosynthesis glycosyltransferase